jgi:hypothetical protein
LLLLLRQLLSILFRHRQSQYLQFQQLQNLTHQHRHRLSHLIQM